MALTIPVSGELTNFVEKAYSFTDQDTGRLTEGTTRTVWVSTGYRNEPVAVKLRQDVDPRVIDSLRDAMPGCRIQLEAEPRANNNRVSYVLETLVTIDAA